MAASAPREHSFASKPTTVADCQSDYRPPAQAAQAAADARNATAQLGAGQQHTHRS
ncbi:hypothetical protein [Streptomyces sp. NRRL F-2664]|uniref:hypothetical protein n=1 Tax=Streptomyces sp. NRRL F-2664 TaxID=1463842 RepID=UPI000AA5AB42|nr:hypothetical protein [Streptomyces sp. NRRL F-2664]